MARARTNKRRLIPNDVLEVPIKGPNAALSTKLRVAQSRLSRLKSKEHVLKNLETIENEPLKADEGEEKVVVEKFIQKTSLIAVKEMRKQLIFAEDIKDRRDAARYFLEASGHGRKEAQLGGGGSIIVIQGLVQGQMPWAPQHPVVEGEVKNAEPAPAQVETRRLQS